MQAASMCAERGQMEAPGELHQLAQRAGKQRLQASCINLRRDLASGGSMPAASACVESWQAEAP